MPYNKSMENYTFEFPTKICFGKGQISRLAQLMKPYGTRVLLGYGGGSIHRNGIYNEVTAILKGNGFTFTELSGIEPNPRIETVQRGVDLCRQNSIQIILAVGGGSTIDCCKAVASGYYYNGNLWDMVMKPETAKQALPLFTVLTLAATGSEGDNGAVISNPALNMKKGFHIDINYPKASICDPAYTFTVPALQTAAGSADIISHILENYFRPGEDAVSDEISEGLLRNVIRALPACLKKPDDYDARAVLMWCSTIGISTLTSAGKGGRWSCHAMEHELSAFYDITHGTGLAIITPRWMEHILNEKTAVKMAGLARRVWKIEEPDDQKAAEKGIRAMRDFFAACGIPMHLRDLGIDRTHFEEMAADAVRLGHLDTEAWVPLQAEDVRAIYEASL